VPHGGDLLSGAVFTGGNWLSCTVPPAIRPRCFAHLKNGRVLGKGPYGSEVTTAPVRALLVHTAQWSAGIVRQVWARIRTLQSDTRE
jgi:hypothetical protein